MQKTGRRNKSKINIGLSDKFKVFFSISFNTIINLQILTNQPIICSSIIVYDVVPTFHRLSNVVVVKIIGY